MPSASSSSQPRFAIIVAGGSGTRMGADRPKQFLELLGEPVLLHTLRRFAAPALGIRRLIVVLPAEQVAIWQALCAHYATVPPHELVAGGATRWASVKQGLALLGPETAGTVAVHDGVRPLTPERVIEATFEAAHNHGAAVAAVVPKDSVRNLSQQGSYALNRSRLRLVQTPQCFELSLLRRAYQLPELNTFTDDASVVEDLHPIHIVEGDYRNLKITTPEDMLLAEALLRTE
ncbi:2-C-methyl-D-erythritol 4-phosphate cytidylyltransferase [Microvirga sp. STR05]|uniref:2-C-methyl-D-erythritol 4-phosphate cytidylyltransferase n=1 Tax=Hymenobacter duratus TaxID=2771356 RepID=A0ABR8JAN7_9BACT|nr:2-C-methyl-D-erythritol 4-phosphate cytidylyltransferase [Hymenobacter duratus]MBD2713662.1 2-C-methyl-D-erythritol 4-phosphate cytidylyltransferase [Hymenobacter duratus]MBR7948564.1 2-C-methyl-D-erythritol 4-phosphate cytidylyltransferase [Microvirga sp. STR05]